MSKTATERKREYVDEAAFQGISEDVAIDYLLRASAEDRILRSSSPVDAYEKTAIRLRRSTGRMNPFTETERVESILEGIRQRVILDEEESSDSFADSEVPRAYSAGEVLNHPEPAGKLYLTYYRIREQVSGESLAEERLDSIDVSTPEGRDELAEAIVDDRFSRLFDAVPEEIDPLSYNLRRFAYDTERLRFNGVESCDFEQRVGRFCDCLLRLRHVPNFTLSDLEDLASKLDFQAFRLTIETAQAYFEARSPEIDRILEYHLLKCDGFTLKSKPQPTIHGPQYFKLSDWTDGEIEELPLLANVLQEDQRKRLAGLAAKEPTRAVERRIRFKGNQKDLIVIIESLRHVGFLSKDTTVKDVVSSIDYVNAEQNSDRERSYNTAKGNVGKGLSPLDTDRLTALCREISAFLELRSD